VSERAGKIAWAAVEDYGELRPYCETPRHAGRGIPSSWVYVFVGEGAEDGFESICAACEACMAIIAGDLGTTPAAGAKRP
jgi:hypothetical protein